jgi:putative oxidoreductase
MNPPEQSQLSEPTTERHAVKNFPRLLLRLTIGGFFVGHGLQKLTGWFGGYGLDATATMFDQLGMRPGKRNAVAAGVAEAGGGAAIIAGAATPLAASALIATMLTAIHRVHLSKGPWASNGGYEYNVVLIVALLALVDAGPGTPSVDASRGRELNGPGWALAALLLAAAGSAGAHVAAEATPPTLPDAPTEAATADAPPAPAAA